MFALQANLQQHIQYPKLLRSFLPLTPPITPVLDSRMLHLDTRLAQTFHETFLGKQINNDQW